MKVRENKTKDSWTRPHSFVKSEFKRLKIRQIKEKIHLNEKQIKKSMQHRLRKGWTNPLKRRIT